MEENNEITVSIDKFREVLNKINNYVSEEIPLSDLARWIYADSKTLTARRRRGEIQGISKKHRIYIDKSTALDLAEENVPVIRGWPRANDVAVKFGMKEKTMHYLIRKEKIRGNKDISDVWRIPESEVEKVRKFAEQISLGKYNYGFNSMEREERYNGKKAVQEQKASNVKKLEEKLKPVEVKTQSLEEFTEKVVEKALEERVKLMILRPVPDPVIKVITNKDYGLPETKKEVALSSKKYIGEYCKLDISHVLFYDSNDLPFISECIKGRSIEYMGRSGTIKKLIDDPFRPQIKVFFPDEKEQKYREMNLLIRKR